jgi:hypothetical protein
MTVGAISAFCVNYTASDRELFLGKGFSVNKFIQSK